MKKPESLRAKLVAAFPELAADPNRLRMWIEQGSLQCNAAPDNLNYGVRYTLTVVIEGWSLPAIMIWVLLIDWLRIQQPELLTPAHNEGERGVPFEADILTATESDISFDLPLREMIRVARRPDGGFDMEYVAEKNVLFPDAQPILPNGPLLQSVWVEGRKLLPEELP